LRVPGGRAYAGPGSFGRPASGHRQPAARDRATTSAKPTLPEISVLARLPAVAVEAPLGRLGLIRARCRPKYALASIAMRLGDVASNLLIAGVVFASDSAAYDVRLFPRSPAWPPILATRPTGS
jgi:hypothetical protein